MTAYDRRSRSHGDGHHPGEKDRRGMWVKNVRVSLAEIASWQLGPDLTQGHESSFGQRRRSTDRH